MWMERLMKTDESKHKYIILGLDKPSIEQQREFIDKIKNAYIEVLNEDKNFQVNIGQAAIGYIKSKLKAERIEKIDYEKLKSIVIKSWPYYNDFCICCSESPLFIMEIDFKRLSKACSLIKSIDCSFDLKLENQDENSPIDGMIISLSDNKYVILINTKVNRNEETILHEFTHYVQLVTKEMRLEINLDIIPSAIQSYFNISDQNVNYVCNEYEFLMNMYNEMFNSLQKIYWSAYKKGIMTWNDFIDAQLGSLHGNVVDFDKTELWKLWDKIVKKNYFYIPTLACIAYVKPDFFNDVVKQMKDHSE